MAAPHAQLSLLELLPSAVSPGAPKVAALPAEPRELPRREVVLEKAQQLASTLSRMLGSTVRLAVTDNRSTMVSYKRGAGGLHLRLHHMFLDAPAHVVEALAEYAGRGRRKAGAVLDAYIREKGPRIRRTRTGDERLEPRGRCFDLRALFDRVNAAHFGGGIQADIGWGRTPARRRRRTIRLGVYEHTTREIRIHPALDDPRVPAYFVEFIVFHEMLHQLFPASPGAGRAQHHPRAFRERERTFPHYRAALAWEAENLSWLLRARVP
ncbi:MAG: hypothetical protein RL653_1474 [Pseudomonadota bacterium]|jgi:hypothetical protein